MGFEMKCEIDLKKVAFGLRIAEYNPRKHPSVTIRLPDPPVTALVSASGIVMLQGKTDEEQQRKAALRVARLVQKCGHVDVRCTNFSVTSIMCKVDLHFPVRIDRLAQTWRRHAMYEPEIFCSCVFWTRNPKACYLVSAGGKVTISGFRKLPDVREAMKRVYSVLYAFRH